MPVGRPKLREEQRKPLKTEAIVVRLHVKNCLGKKTTISLEPVLIEMLADQLGGKDRARAWLREIAAGISTQKGRSFSRTVQTAAVRKLSSVAPNPL